MMLLITVSAVSSIQIGIVRLKTTMHQQIANEVAFQPGNYFEKLLQIYIMILPSSE